MACIDENAPMASGMTAASAPPATITSAMPRLIISALSPRACALEAHAETCVRLGPRTPNCIDTCAEAAFAMSIGTRNGDSRLGPRFSMTRFITAPR